MNHLYGDDILPCSYAVTAVWRIMVERISTGEQVEGGLFRGSVDAALRHAEAVVRAPPTDYDLRVVAIIRDWPA